MAIRNWTRDELILTINLYCKLSFGQLHKNNPKVIELSKTIDRTPSAVAWKLVNFSSLDPSIRRRGLKGANHTSKLDEEIWYEFFDNLSELAFESEALLAKYANQNIIETTNIYYADLPKEGKERKSIIKSRVNQSFFRRMILSSYENKCSITGLPITELLVASHIVPWANDTNNRMNPCNGICLNALHDRAFDKGLITITNDYKLVISKRFRVFHKESSINQFFNAYDGQKLSLPQRFLPKQEFLEYHQENVFVH